MNRLIFVSEKLKFVTWVAQRNRLHVLSDLASLAKYPEVKMAAEDQERWRVIKRTGMP